MFKIQDSCPLGRDTNPFLCNIDSDYASGLVIFQPKNVLVAIPESAVKNLIAFNKLGGIGQKRSKMYLCLG
jgi:hypothetical protein